MPFNGMHLIRLWLGLCIKSFCLGFKDYDSSVEEVMGQRLAVCLFED